ncbi:predicted protein [Sclerotinia sclerotiorum 1980 UF-70]|uniref:Uncharacterized protein n=2 Tax=Sclerotinia sclerotiorum (strain ATCC 18683 / 1980 / Ss-1) TaxID=665079 RepID=A0A1D9QIE3_SCLS1|nr:predicted protein [Sclerotinia sclerotiorum 1980 UF-70]APA14562.1 hypothetical protein sscle_13g093320 [Sclerotinia sclerotiorum 1980 UF-70]EDO04034.1 predicted protein [Sclerotinia sclerotiorum 1980 UF-70]
MTNPAVVLFNWSSLSIFVLANIPQGLMTRSEVRLAMQLLIPAILAISHRFLNVGAEIACLLIATWVYNDLKAMMMGGYSATFSLLLLSEFAIGIL